MKDYEGLELEGDSLVHKARKVSDLDVRGFGRLESPKITKLSPLNRD